MKNIRHYIIENRIGDGGFSTVYMAKDSLNDSLVAIKMLNEALLENQKARDRFRQEAEMLMALNHPAIVPILDFGSEAGRLFVVMPYMAAGSLQERLSEGPLPFERAVDIAGRVADALDAAHAKHIIHRDIKPQNILIGEDAAAYLSDFGVARNYDPDAAGEAATLIGTPEFMAPEQATQGQISPQTDVYQLGVTLFQMLTGRRPFAGAPLEVNLKTFDRANPIGRVDQSLIADRYRPRAADRSGQKSGQSLRLGQ